MQLLIFSQRGAAALGLHSPGGSLVVGRTVQRLPSPGRPGTRKGHEVTASPTS